MLTPIARKMQGYRRSVLEKRIHCDLPQCPLGKDCPGTSFRLHDRRERTFLYIEERPVHKAKCLLSRWKCLLCGQTFTLYPSFALPLKRYVATTVCALAESYVEEEALSYRKAVRERGLPIFHADDPSQRDGPQHDDCRDDEENRDQGAQDPRTFEHSTLYRWLAFFAALVKTRREALRLIRAKSPSSGVFRQISPVVPRKYRSAARRKLLQRARQLFVAGGAYVAVFGTSIFPRLATSCCWN